MNRHYGSVVLESADFFIAKADRNAAFKAVKRLGVKGDDQRHFMWMNLADPAKWRTLRAAMSDWGFPATEDADGNIVDISYESDKFGEQHRLFDVLAPFVRDGSTLEFYGEDGERWRWSFHGGKCYEITPVLAWPEPWLSAQ